MRLDGKVALITGSTRGIGRTMAEMFAAEGAKVVLSGRSVDKGEMNVERIRAAGGEAMFLPIDVTDEDSVREGVAATVDAYGTITTLINNAAPTALVNVSFKPLHELTLQEWDDIVRGSVTSAFLMTKHTVPHMIEAGGGSIVNISSQLGLVGTDNSSPQYQASKGAVRLLTKATAIQYASEGIRANSVHPGPIVTPMTERRRADPETYRKMLSRIPLGRFGESDEVAYGVLYLASDEAAFVTGSELVIDGGWTAQ